MVCNVLFKNEDQAICPAECVNVVNRDERAFVKHGRMQDLLRVAQHFVAWPMGTRRNFRRVGGGGQAKKAPHMERSPSIRRTQ